MSLGVRDAKSITQYRREHQTQESIYSIALYVYTMIFHIFETRRQNKMNTSAWKMTMYHLYPGCFKINWSNRDIFQRKTFDVSAWSLRVPPLQALPPVKKICAPKYSHDKFYVLLLMWSWLGGKNPTTILKHSSTNDRNRPVRSPERTHQNTYSIALLCGHHLVHDLNRVVKPLINVLYSCGKVSDIALYRQGTIPNT